MEGEERGKEKREGERKREGEWIREDQKRTRLQQFLNKLVRYSDG